MAAGPSTQVEDMLADPCTRKEDMAAGHIWDEEPQQVDKTLVASHLKNNLMNPNHRRMKIVVMSDVHKTTRIDLLPDRQSMF